jgi:hypothetical protein
MFLMPMEYLYECAECKNKPTASQKTIGATTTQLNILHGMPLADLVCQPSASADNDFLKIQSKLKHKQANSNL